MSIEQRLAKLERESRNWRLVALCFALGAGVAISYSLGSGGRLLPSVPGVSAADAAPNDVIAKVRTKNLEIVNDNGSTVAYIAALDTGAELRMLRLDEPGSVVLYAAAGVGSSINVHGDVGKSAISENGVAVYAYDPAVVLEQNRIHAKLAKDGRGPSDEERRKLLVSPSGPAVNIGFTPYRGGIVSVANPDGKCVATMLSDKLDQGTVAVSNAQGNLSNGLSPR